MGRKGKYFIQTNNLRKNEEMRVFSLQRILIKIIATALIRISRFALLECCTPGQNYWQASKRRVTKSMCYVCMKDNFSSCMNM